MRAWDSYEGLKVKHFCQRKNWSSLSASLIMWLCLPSTKMLPPKHIFMHNINNKDQISEFHSIQFVKHLFPLNAIPTFQFVPASWSIFWNCLDVWGKAVRYRIKPCTFCQYQENWCDILLLSLVDLRGWNDPTIVKLKVINYDNYYLLLKTKFVKIHKTSCNFL